MERIKRQLLPIVLAIIIVVGSLPMTGWAAETMKVSISSVNGSAGSDVQVKVSLSDNPGVSSLRLMLDYDSSILELKALEYNSELGGQTIALQKMDSPVTLIWVSAFANCDLDTTFATLTFGIKEEAEEGAVANITATFNPDDIYNMSEANVPTEVINGSVEVLTCIPGDINGDETVNNKDVTRMFQYLANWEVTVNEPALDTNGDGTVNNKDLTRLFQHLANWDVEIFCGSVKSCKHSLDCIPAVAATCLEAGNIEYYQCKSCKKYFSDSAALSEIKLADTVIAKGEHTIEIIPAVPATDEHEGLTEGKKCSLCNEVIVAQEPTPILERNEYAISYDLYNGDAYLQSVGITNGNPDAYSSKTGLTLRNVSAKGYKFLGWYDLPAGSNAEIVKSIPAGTTGEIELYAHWEKEVYEVEFEFPTQFNADLVLLDKVTYTVDKGVVLPTPSLDGYIFAGWSDDDGNVIKKVPVGSTGAKQYTANWLSRRNQAWTKQSLDDPIIMEDSETNTILFTYEIGEIRNVPVDVIENFGYINSNGISKTVTKKYATEVDEALMQTYENTVSNATVNSFGWTLSNDWSDSTSIDEEWCKENGMSVEEGEEYCKSDTSGWYVSSGRSGSTTTEKLDTKDLYDLKTNTHNSSVGGEESSSTTHSAKIANTLTIDVGVESELKAKGGVDGIGFEGGVKQSVGVSDTLTVEASGSHTATDSSNFSLSGGVEKQGGSVSHKGTNTTSNSSWNSESGYNGSSTVSNSSSISKAVTESISNKYGYGKTYIIGGEESTNQGMSSTDTSSDSYGSSVTFSTKTSMEEEVSYTTTNTKTGFHRWVMADTAHVFATVGYDIATASYFVNTYTVMEDNLEPYEDYSCSSSSYDDNQNSFIGFEVPYNTITEYVVNRVGESEGLEVNSSGMITGYTGTDEYVVVPEYKVIKNQDGTNSVIKVTGIAENAFKDNKNIIGIMLSTFIYEIPANAFEGCMSLVEVQGCLKSIGANAFSGCSAMKTVMLGWGLTFLGENAFDSAEDITLYAINKDVISTASEYNAKNITVYVTSNCDIIENTTFSIMNATESFIFNGYGKTFTNVVIESNAKKTEINRATFESDGKTPLQLSSSEVVLQEVTVNAPAIGLVCTADNTSLNMYGESNINSNGANAVLCKNLKLGKIKNDYFSRLNVSGNILVCGSVDGKEYLLIENGGIVIIDEATFEKYKKGVIKLTFDSNNGSTITETKTVYFGQVYGDLPTPTRANYTFDGWYTAVNDGDKITADSIIITLTNQTLYAHWTPNQFTLNYNANGGNVSSASKTLTFGDSFGSLPTPTRDYYTFDGWFTAPSDGTPVSANTKPDAANDITIYAHWRQNAPSDWVRRGDMPGDAQVVSQKWSYTLRNYTSSGNSSMSGWTKYDTQRTSWSGWSGWATWNPDNGVRNVEWRSAYDHTEYHYYRWVNSRHTSLYTYRTGDCTILEERWFNRVLPRTAEYGSIGYDGSDTVANWWVRADYSGNYSVDKTWARDIYRDEWRYQDPVYTYYFYKDENKESSSYPDGNDISNIQEWVQYRAK